VAVRVGAGVSVADAAIGVRLSLSDVGRTPGAGTTHAPITASPRMPAAIHGFRLRRGFVFSGTDLVIAFSVIDWVFHDTLRIFHFVGIGE